MMARRRMSRCRKLALPFTVLSNTLGETFLLPVACLTNQTPVMELRYPDGARGKNLRPVQPWPHRAAIEFGVATPVRASV